MKSRRSLNSFIVEKMCAFVGSTALISFVLSFSTSAKQQAESNLDASIAKADEAIARIDETRAQSQKSMEESDKVLAEVESNRNRFSHN